MTIVPRIARAAAVGAALLIGAGLYAPAAQAGYTVKLTEVGSNVVANGSGAVSLTNLTFSSNTTESAIIIPNIGNIITGPLTFEPATVYTGVTVGSASFGSGIGTSPDSGSGNVVGISGVGQTLIVPEGYVSGTALPDTSTYDNQTFASLGVTPGHYEWVWGSGADQNFTLDVGVPEPSSLLLLALPLGLVMLLAGRHRRLTRNA